MGWPQGLGPLISTLHRSALDRQPCAGCTWHVFIPSVVHLFPTKLQLARFLSQAGAPPTKPQLLLQTSSWAVAPREQTCGSERNPGPPPAGQRSCAHLGKAGGPAGHGSSCRVARASVRGGAAAFVLSLHSGKPGEGGWGPLPPSPSRREGWSSFSRACLSFQSSLVCPRDSRVPSVTGVLDVVFSNTPPQRRAFWAGSPRP